MDDVMMLAEFCDNWNDMGSSGRLGRFCECRLAEE